jgi:hypothetical protein
MQSFDRSFLYKAHLISPILFVAFKFSSFVSRQMHVVAGVLLSFLWNPLSVVSTYSLGLGPNVHAIGTVSRCWSNVIHFM